MSYKFLNDNFIEINKEDEHGNSALENFVAFKEKSFILKHNIDALSKIINFLDSSESVFILNGFMGSGKTYVADCILDFLSASTLVFRTSYQEAINLDDILLSLFKDFYTYHNQRKINLPKIESNVFSDKINAFIKACDAPMLFIFDSFEINMRSEGTQNDIIDFINYLAHFPKVKVIICSRTFKTQDLNLPGTTLTASLNSLSQKDMEEYLRQNEITGNETDIEDLYNITRGHFLLIELSVLIMQLLDYTLAAYSSEYKKSSKNFIEFLISKILSVSSDRFMKLLVFMALVRHGISIDFIINQQLAQEDDIEFLMQKQVVSEKFGLYYMKDYIKKEFVKTLSTESRINVHKYLKEVYEQELPLKPFERQLYLSRLTMRQEIAHHMGIIELLSAELDKASALKNKDTQGLSYLTYVRASGIKIDETKGPESKRYLNSLRNKAEKIKKSEPSKEDLLLFGAESTDALNEQFQFITDITDSEIISNNNDFESGIYTFIPESLSDYIEIGKNCENAFNYSDAILYYRKALTYTQDPTFKENEPIIYLRIANCYKKVQDIEQATNIYEKVFNIYKQISSEEANKVLLVIAGMYCEIYKFDKAREYYNRILSSTSQISNKLKIRVYLDLAEIEDSNDIQDTARYIKKALSIAEKIADPEVLSECYYKYALLLDETNNLEMASNYYLRCVQACTDSSINKNIAEAYSNLAAISVDSHNISAAKMYYELAVDAYNKQNNYEGLYYSYFRLSEIYKLEKSNRTLEYLVNSLNCAKKLEDVSLVVEAYINIGDFYLEKTMYKEAIKSFILSRTMAGGDDTEEIREKIRTKLSKIKMILGESEYNRLLDEIKNKK